MSVTGDGSGEALPPIEGGAAQPLRYGNGVGLGAPVDTGSQPGGTATFGTPNRAQRRAYVRQRKVYVLRFEQAELQGLEVRARSVPLGTFLELIELASVLDASTAELSPTDAKAITGLFSGFAQALVSWNLQEQEDGAEPEDVPATYEGLLSQDTDFVLHVVRAWMDAIAGVSGPLEQPSSDGEKSLVASMPMETSSASPPT